MALRFDHDAPPDEGTQEDTGLVILLGPRPQTDWRCWRVGARGIESEHVFTPGGEPPWSEAAVRRVVALVPAALSPVRIAPRGDMPAAQALAAARLEPPGLADTAETHVAAAIDEDGDHVLTCAVACAAMDTWLAALAAAGLDAQALVPAALVLPAATDGAVLAGDLGGQVLARTCQAAFAGEDALMAGLSGGAVVEDVPANRLATRLAEIWRTPPLDLRQGVYAPPRVSYFHLPDWRQLARMAAVFALLVFAVLAVETIKLNADASIREGAALAAARVRFPGAGDLAGAQAQIRTEMVRRGVGGTGLPASASAVFAAMQPIPSVSLRSLVWRPDGTLAIRAAAPRTEDINALLVALQRDGWLITVPSDAAPDPTGATVADISVRAP